MNVSTFDTLTAARTLREAGFEARQAEAIIGVVRHAVGADRDSLATKAGPEAGFADPDFAASRSDIHRALWVQSAAITAAMAAANAALFAAVEFFR